ncbi:fimbria/pilus outer membrane usher protein [Pseudomonas sp. LD120]|uniref:fimbria/pilus outer membrane usher protein n=1 Tax=Pseudomonas sp. LD120 TaxID=485751 RepID=UPI00135B6F08|nr:fimbria/pilus outer membrane usher protein [Pseudomonas sp. LD120]KAF0864491.1 fimbria/pilus outer membrane usher protein [Pseudomonas sp. LD120]
MMCAHRLRLLGLALAAPLAWPVAADPATVAPAANASPAYQFNPRLLRGARPGGLSVERFNQTHVTPAGRYSVDVLVNGSSLGRQDLHFEEGHGQQLKACFSTEQLLELGVQARYIKNALEENCAGLGKSVKGASERLDFAALRLQLSIPQAALQPRRRGQVPSNQWSHGEPTGFVNYSASHFHLNQAGGNTYSSYLGVRSGANLGEWRLRHHASLTASSDQPNRWTPLRTYAQRTLADWGSELTLGDTFTSGQLLSSLGYRGVQLASDERMLPESQRGYAPTVHGVANSNARVVIRQDGNELYQTTVAPGPFRIDDLYPTGYGGDLDVEVTEADGQVSTYRVPFSAMPDALRPGQSRYSVAAGQVRNNGMDLPYEPFAEGSYEYGLSNALTLRSASRVADGYLSALLGGVYSNSIGAFGLNSTYSAAQLPDGRQTGWMTQASFSRTFQSTGTSLSMGNARYSTEGYRELIDAIGERERTYVPEDWSSSSYQKKTRFDLQVSQNLGNRSSLFITGSQQNYRHRSGQDRQFQFGYSGSFANGVSYNLSIARQFDSRGQHSDTQHVLSLSLPLGASGSRSKLSTSFSHSASQGSQQQASLSGSAGKDNDLSYGLNASRAHNNPDGVLGGTLQKRLSSATVGASLSHGDDFWQASASAMGALVLHSGGLTSGPYLGDTFALIEAKGAEGALVMNGQGARIDKAGYALMPSLTPFRYNDVGLSSNGLHSAVELQETQQRVAPTAGAAVHLQFKTLAGFAVLIQAPREQGESLPMGTTVQDSQGRVVGMVGQASQLYARVEAPQGLLSLQWGDHPDQQCQVQYQIPEADLKQPMINLSGTCRPSRTAAL